MRRMLLAVGVLACASFAAAQTTWHVNGSCGDDTWTGLSEVCQAPDGPKATIQAALNAAEGGDTVLVADGRYTGPGNRGLTFNGEAIHLRSAGGAEACVIDCEGQGSAFWFVLFEPVGTLVEGFAITRASASAVFVHHEAQPEFRDCVFRGNRGGQGGALQSDTASAPVLRRCRIEDNEAGQGGGIFIIGEGTNRALFIDCVIAGNRSAGDGGGVYCIGPAPRLVNCLIVDNSAAGDGGAVQSVSADPELVNCTISGNTATRGGAIAASGASGTPRITSSVLWGNSAGLGAEIALVQTAERGDVTLRIAHSALEGGAAAAHVEPGAMLEVGAGVIDADPMFADPAAGDFQLLAGSPGIDAGDNTALPAGVTTDLAGSPRFVDDPAAPDVGVPGGAGGAAIVDMGAYERQDFCYADCDGSGGLDFFDFLCFQDAFAAGEAYADCDGSGGLDFFDFLCFQEAFAAGCP